MPARTRVAIAAVWLVSIVVGLAAYMHLRRQGLYYDAAVYMQAGNGMREGGLLSAWPYAAVRTYGYPAILAGASSIASLLNISLLAAIFVFQWSAFAATAWLLSRTIFSNHRAQNFAFLAIAANPLLVVYAPQVLTESLTLTCILFSVAALGRGARSGSFAGRLAWLVAGAVASGYALEIRPANILVPVCYGVVAPWVLVWVGRRRAVLTASLSTVLILGGLAAPLVPQVMVNWHNYGVRSPMPVTNIGTLQSELGIQNVRYATNVSACGAPALPFSSPFPAPAHPDTSITGLMKFYLLTWPSGPEMAWMHIFSGLDPRPFLTYQVSFGAGYERVLQAFTLMLVLFAARALINKQWARHSITPDRLFLGVVTVASTAILAVSQAELRFGTLLVASLSLLAATAAAQLKRPRLKAVAFSGAAFVVLLIGWYAMSDLVLSRSDIWVACS